MTRKRTICVAIAVAAVPTSMSAAAETYFVIGVGPPFTQVLISDGNVADGKFRQSFAARMWGGHTYWERPEDGYILIKAGGEPNFAILRVQVHDSAGAIGGTIYSPCEDAGPKGFAETVLNVRGVIPGGAMVFMPPEDKVTYIGNVTFALSDDEYSLRPTFTNDLEGARAYLRAHHPDMAERLEQGTYELMPAKGCP